MTTLTIHIPEKKADLVKKLLKELDVKIDKPISKKSLQPNEETINAIKDARLGKTKKINDLKSFFETI